MKRPLDVNAKALYSVENNQNGVLAPCEHIQHGRPTLKETLKETFILKETLTL